MNDKQKDTSWEAFIEYLTSLVKEELEEDENGSSKPIPNRAR